MSSSIGKFMKGLQYSRKPRRRPTASARKEMEEERQQEEVHVQQPHGHEQGQEHEHEQGQGHEHGHAQEQVDEQRQGDEQGHFVQGKEDDHFQHSQGQGQDQDQDQDQHHFQFEQSQGQFQQPFEQDHEPLQFEQSQGQFQQPFEQDQEPLQFDQGQDQEPVEQGQGPLQFEQEQGQGQGQGQDQDTYEPQIEHGFPGGPRDTSLLTTYESHVAAYIWAGKEERGILKCHNHTHKLLNWVIPDGEASRVFRGMVSGVALSRLRNICYVDVNKVLVSSFVERWHPETNSFHMPFGEMTITLDDVFCLLGLPIVGDALSSARDVDASYVSHMLGVPLEEVYEGMGNKRGASLTLEWLRARFNDDVTSEDDFRVGCAVRAYYLLVLGCTIFADKSGTRVPISYLEWLEDLEHLDGYAWGAATLAYLYRQLGQASRYSTKQIAGSMTLLEAWIYLRFPTLRPAHNVDYKSKYPLAHRWIPQGNQGRRADRLFAAREHLDRLTSRDVAWLPYDNKVRRWFEWHRISTYLGCIQMGNIVEPYHPDRVLRQFGYVQTIPSTVLAPNCGPRDNSKALPYWIGFALSWSTSDSHLLSEERLGRRAVRDWDCAPGYIDWYRERSHVVVQPRHRRSRYVNTTTTDAVAADSHDRMLGVITGLIDPTVRRWRSGDRSIPYVDLGSLLDRVHTVINGPPDDAGPSHRRQQ